MERSWHGFTDCTMRKQRHDLSTQLSYNTTNNNNIITFSQGAREELPLLKCSLDTVSGADSVVSVWYLNRYWGWVALPQAAEGELVGPTQR